MAGELALVVGTERWETVAFSGLRSPRVSRFLGWSSKAECRGVCYWFVWWFILGLRRRSLCRPSKAKLRDVCFWLVWWFTLVMR